MVSIIRIFRGCENGERERARERERGGGGGGRRASCDKEIHVMLGKG